MIKIFKDKNEKYRFNFVKNEVVGRSSGSYDTSENALQDINRIKDNVECLVVDLTKDESSLDTRFEIYKGDDDQFWFRFVYADDGVDDNLLTSEGYTSKQNCKKGIKSVCDVAKENEITYPADTISRKPAKSHKSWLN